VGSKQIDRMVFWLLTARRSLLTIKGTTMILEITLTKSPIGRPPKHRLTVKSLGLTRLQKTVRHRETPAILGMVRQVEHLLQVRQVPEGE
jgi:large subunit ribosomal protein L30